MYAISVLSQGPSPAVRDANLTGCVIEAHRLVSPGITRCGRSPSTCVFTFNPLATQTSSLASNRVPGINSRAAF